MSSTRRPPSRAARAPRAAAALRPMAASGPAADPRPVAGLRAVASLALGALALGAVPAASAADDYFVYVSPDPIGVNAFLQMGKSGTELAAEAAGAEVATYESTTAAARRENLEAAIDEGATLVVLLGFEFNDAVAELAPTATDVDFLIVDQCIESPPANVHCAVFREYESAHLMGVAAAMLTETKRVGMVGALDIPFLHRHSEGFAGGVRAVDADVEVDVRWVGGQNPFADPVRAKEQALALHGAGADVILAATAGGDFGVFEAAEEAGFDVMNVDVNFCDEAPGRIVDSMIKRVDEAIGQSVRRILAGEDAVFLSLGLAEGGMSAIALDEAGLGESGCAIADHPEVVEAVRAEAERIVSGELELEDPMFAR